MDKLVTSKRKFKLLRLILNFKPWKDNEKIKSISDSWPLLKDTKMLQFSLHDDKYRIEKTG